METDNQIMVSVHMITYNHEDTIAKAIESVINQKTHYKFELVIGDDASSDRTPSIIREYAEKYPNIIVAVCREKNIGAKANSEDIGKRCRGKYIAECEGDDYWISDDKLEKQVSFLEDNPVYSMCVGRCQFIVDGKEEKYPFSKEGSYSMSDMLNGGNLKRYATATFLYRNIIYQNEIFLAEFTGIVGDIIVQTIMMNEGKIHYIDEDFAVYNRVTAKGNTSFSASKLSKQIAEIRKAVDSCKHISGKEYNYLWEAYMSMFNKGLYREIKDTEGNISAIRWIIRELRFAERFVLARALIIDYLAEKRKKLKKVR